MYTSECIKLRERGHYSANLGTVLGQIATGGGGDHLEEQLSNMGHCHHTALLALRGHLALHLKTL